MNKQQPSILNDVIGPVMRGPSSSHVAGAARIGELVRQSVNGLIRDVICDFDVNGSLAESHEGHGTDMGFACGLMGLPLTDSRVDQYNAQLQKHGIHLEYRILDYGAVHPNFYRVSVTSLTGQTVALDAISTGGGMIEVTALEGFPVQMMGGSAQECVNAASMALQGLTGLVCDPAANRVEVPCLNKNIMAGMNALSSVNMTLAGFDPVIPLDETIGAVYDIGTKLPGELRCTWGGLGKTPASMKIRANLEQAKCTCSCGQR